MNPYDLLKAIKKRLEPDLAALPLAIRSREKGAAPDPVITAKNGVRFVASPQRPAAIYLGAMPPTASEALSAAPFVAIQAMDGEDDGDFLHTIRVALRLCATGFGEEEAEADLFALLSQIRLSLLRLPGGSLGAFRLVPFGETQSRLPWERPDEQVFPFLQAHIFSQWQTAGALMEASAAD